MSFRRTERFSSRILTISIFAGTIAGTGLAAVPFIEAPSIERQTTEIALVVPTLPWEADELGPPSWEEMAGPGTPADRGELPVDEAEIAHGPPSPIRVEVRVAAGDTLGAVLQRHGVDVAEGERVVSALREVFDPRKLRAGRLLVLTFEPPVDAEPEAAKTGETGPVTMQLASLTPVQAAEPEPAAEVEPGDEEAEEVSEAEAASQPFTKGLVLRAVRFRPEAGVTIEVARNDEGGFVGEEKRAPVETRYSRLGGGIENSLYQDGRGVGIPHSILSAMIRHFSYDVDFQRDLQPKDRFEAVFERMVTPWGEVVRAGELLKGTLVLRGKVLRMYRFESDDGVVEYFNEKGEGIRKALLKTPIDGARLSSGFGPRRHPILGYTKMHTGVDFAAPTGTPIYAAGDGVIERADRFGGYGNYIRIRHNKTYSTAYAHMSRFAGGMSTGKRVAQGDVIGFVGSTGRSTGPHLHYEILENGRHVNPAGVKFPSGRSLEGKELKRFIAVRDWIDGLDPGADMVGKPVAEVTAPRTSTAN